MMIGRFGWILLAVLMTVSLDTVTCADEVQAEGSLVAGTEQAVETPPTLPPNVIVAAPASITISNTTITIHPNVTVTPVTSPPATNSTEETPITETIRTYIEDSVKSVKHAISKIGKFVGEFFEDAPTNTTVPANVSVTTVSLASTTVVNGTTLPPTSVAPAAVVTSEHK